MGNKSSSSSCNRLSKWCFRCDAVKSHSSTDPDVENDTENTQERIVGTCEDEQHEEAYDLMQEECLRRHKFYLKGTQDALEGEWRPVCCDDQVSTPFKTQGPLDAYDYKIYPPTPTLKLEFKHASQEQTKDATICCRETMRLDLPSHDVECDEGRTPDDILQRHIFQGRVPAKKTQNKYKSADHSRPPHEHQQSSFLQDKQDTTSDDDDRNKAIEAHRFSSCSLHSSLDCFDKSSSEEDLREVEQGDNSLQTTDPASSMFCSKWEVSGVFGSEGGVLQKLDSDVQLVIPPGAIKSGFNAAIHAAVNADLEHLYDKLKGKLKQEEVIVSPAAEYWVGKDWKFEQPVTVKLPHFLPSDYAEDEVRVYHITRDAKGGVLLSAIQKGGDSKAVTSSFCVNEDYVCVQIDHFSAVLCTYCSGKSEAVRYPDMFIIGKGTLTNCGSYQAINLRVLMWDKRLHIRDFMNEEHGVKLEEYNEPVFIEISSKILNSFDSAWLRAFTILSFVSAGKQSKQSFQRKQRRLTWRRNLDARNVLKKVKIN